MRRDIAGGALLLALSIAYLIGASQIPHSSLSDEIGARGLPYVLGVLLALVSVCIVVRGVFATDQGEIEGEADDNASFGRVLGLLGCAAIFIGVAWLAGYIVACALTLLAVMLYEGAKPGLRVVAVAVFGALFFWAVFVLFLGVEQPVGKLFGG